MPFKMCTIFHYICLFVLLEERATTPDFPLGVHTHTRAHTAPSQAGKVHCYCTELTQCVSASVDAPIRTQR